MTDFSGVDRRPHLLTTVRDSLNHRNSTKGLQSRLHKRNLLDDFLLISSPQAEMDNFQLRQQLMESMGGLANIFAELFPVVADNSVNVERRRTNTSSETIETNQGHINMIPATSLTPSQLQSIHRLSVYLSKSQRCLDRLHRLYFRNYDGKKTPSEIDEIETNAEIKRLQDTLTKSKVHEGKILKALSATQDYLKNEVNRSVELDKELKSKEDTLVRVTAERNKLLKFVNNVELKPDDRRGDRSLQSQRDEFLRTTITSSPLDIEMPETYCGSFVRKKFGPNSFFGLIVKFSRPFFKIVYEDSDEEEMTFKDLSEYLWRSDVPSTKSLQCKRHATRLALYSTGGGTAESIEINNDTDKESLASENGNNINDNNCDKNRNDFTNNGTATSSSSSSSSSIPNNLKRKNLFCEPERTCNIATRFRGSRSADLVLEEHKTSLFDWNSKVHDRRTSQVKSNSNDGNVTKVKQNGDFSNTHNLIVIDDSSDNDESDGRSTQVNSTVNSAERYFKILDGTHSVLAGDISDEISILSFHKSSNQVRMIHPVQVSGDDDINLGSSNTLPTNSNVVRYVDAPRSQSSINSISGIFSPKLRRPKTKG